MRSNMSELHAFGDAPAKSLAVRERARISAAAAFSYNSGSEASRGEAAGRR